MVQDLDVGDLGTNCGNQLFEFYYNFTNWLPHDTRSGCGESQNKVLTALYPFFFRLLVLYFYVAPSRVFLSTFLANFLDDIR